MDRVILHPPFMLWHPKTQKILKVIWFGVAILLIIGMVLIYIPL